MSLVLGSRQILYAFCRSRDMWGEFGYESGMHMYPLSPYFLNMLSSLVMRVSINGGFAHSVCFLSNLMGREKKSKYGVVICGYCVQ